MHLEMSVSKILTQGGLWYFYQKFVEMTSKMIYIVALSLKCPRKIHLNTQWGVGGASNSASCRNCSTAPFVLPKCGSNCPPFPSPLLTDLDQNLIAWELKTPQNTQLFLNESRSTVSSLDLFSKINFSPKKFEKFRFPSEIKWDRFL